MSHAGHCNYSYSASANHIYSHLCNDGYMESKSEMIKRRRKELGLTQQEVANTVGVSRVAVTKWENGDTGSLKNDNLSKLLKLFGISFPVFMGADEETPESHIDFAVRQSGSDAVIYAECKVPAPSLSEEAIAIAKKFMSLSPGHQEDLKVHAETLTLIEDHVREAEAIKQSGPQTRRTG